MAQARVVHSAAGFLASCPPADKLFQSKFIAVISPGASQFVKMQWTLLNSGIALLGCERRGCHRWAEGVRGALGSCPAGWCTC